MDAAARAYVALRLDGKDVLLMAADHARRRELSRRIRDDLIHLGLVSPARPSGSRSGSRARAGDLIVCTRNDHHVEAGTSGPDAGQRRPAPDRGGHRAWPVRAPRDRNRPGDRRPCGGQAGNFLYGDYHDCELGYAVTDHVAQSRTVHTALALITGLEDRQHFYVGMTRGDPRQPRLRAHHVTQARRPHARPPPRTRTRPLRPAASPPRRPPRPATRALTPTRLDVLAQVISRDGHELSATEIRRQNLADADHLAILHAIWITETTPHRDQRYRDLLASVLPAEFGTDLGPKAKWLYRTLRAAELAGLDPAEVITHAVAQRSLRDASDVAAVIDARIRQRIRGTWSRSQPRPWSGQIPQLPDPHRHDYITQIARAMDERKERIGNPPRRAPARLGSHRARPGARRAPGPGRLAAARQLRRCLPRTVRIPPPRRSHRLRTGQRQPGQASRLARGVHRSPARRRRPGPRHDRRAAASPAQHLRRRHRMGAAVGRRRAAAGPARRNGRPPRRHPRRCRSQPSPQQGPARRGRPAR